MCKFISAVKRVLAIERASLWRQVLLTIIPLVCVFQLIWIWSQWNIQWNIINQISLIVDG